MTAQRWKLTIEYFGAPYSGWQRQRDGISSVQQKIEEAISGFCQQDLRLHVAGRTDAGVHAAGQVAHFDLDYGDRELTPFDLMRALNAHLRDEPISIIHAETVDDEFHARFSAINKLYTYRVLNRTAPPSFDEGRVWHVWGDLDVDAMREGARHLLGHHDFSTFRASECQAKSPMKTLDRADIEAFDLPHGARDVRFQFEGRSFLHHQVRNMVGSLILVGQGRWTPDGIRIALDAKDRKAGGPTCPPDGLYLMRIDY